MVSDDSPDKRPKSIDDLLPSYEQSKFGDEAALMAELGRRNPLSAEAAARAGARATRVVQALRSAERRPRLVEGFLQEYGLDSDEGLVLMALAECLLRIPDSDTVDALLAEKLVGANWLIHRGHSPSAGVNAGTQALLLAQQLLAAQQRGEGAAALLARMGEPAMRLALRGAMRLIGDAFVYAPSIDEALDKAQRRQLAAHSFDMLGEAARCEADAQRYLEAYLAAIDAIGERGPWPPGQRAPGISVKLSALHPRFEYSQCQRLQRELYPRLLALAQRAQAQGIGLTIDAEEVERLTLTLELLQRLCQEHSLRGWAGLGLAVQAYQKRAFAVIERLQQMAVANGRSLLVRLVKGAYWDSEIKRAQQLGLPGYPVFTHKTATDCNYLVCAARLLQAAPVLQPQFASHNAYTLAALLELADGCEQQQGCEIEFQRLHGMGEALFETLGDDLGQALFVRAYAPVGAHRDLLPYLVRRLLENGANSSFVHHLLDERAPVATLVGDPFHRLPELTADSGIALPAALYPDRANSRGCDLSEPESWSALRAASAAAAAAGSAPCIVSGIERGELSLPVCSPQAPQQILGHRAEADDTAINDAFAAASAAQPAWDARGGEARAELLEAAANELEASAPRFYYWLQAEAGKSWTDAVAELREAVDFCRYYALQARRQFTTQPLAGPTGESNSLRLQGRGVVVCISPWNFPLAIFTGQVVAALVAGNAVLAKPAEHTPLIAAELLRLLLRCGVPPEVLHLLPGKGSRIGARLMADPRLAAVAFTGSTVTAKTLQRCLAASDGAIAALIAETGGINAMVADTTALPEQLCDAVIRSAFLSAGQRCSALRLLLLPQVSAEQVLAMIAGAVDALSLGDPREPATDIGPVISAAARDELEAYVEQAQRRPGIELRYRYPASRLPAAGHFFAPAILKLRDVALLEREVFGPVLHVFCYPPHGLEPALAQLRRQGYGLTLGIHSRLEAFCERVQRLLPVGNTYINRDMVGAVVGVQPFGGRGLSGTGPKAGGPHYLPAFAVEATRTENTAASGGDVELYRR